MSLRVLKEIRTAVSNLNPQEVRAAAERPLRIGLLASSEPAFECMERFLLPPDKVSDRKRAEASALLRRVTPGDPPEHFDLVLCERRLRCPENGFVFDPDH